jgi:hypothetical protein
VAVTFSDLKTMLRHGAKIAEAAVAMTDAAPSLELVKRAAVNVAIATEFPLSAGLQAWRRHTLPERFAAAMADEQIRAWLLSWAGAPRPLTIARRKVRP